MKIRMRVVHHPENGNSEVVASAIAKAQEANVDRIPPAYPVENEKLLIVCVELKGSIDNAVKSFIQNINSSRVKNVAFCAIGSGDFSALDQLKKPLEEKGIHLAGDTLTCEVKGGLFKKGTVSADQIQGAVSWADKIVDSLVD